ncbi:MAG: 3-dehydroquinate synthase [Anaerolineae bacterium]
MRNLVITGFMGTGKSAVGEEVAQRLGRPFVDMDTEIAARAGKSVARIFAEDGEATFRRMEAALCAELAAREGLVVATGGGALVNPESRTRMLAVDTVVCLTADVPTILRRTRVEGGAARPLLQGDDPRAEIERLLAEREAAYAAIPWQVKTMGKSIAAVADEVAAFAQVHTLRVRYPGGAYPVHVGAGLRHHLGDALRAADIPPASKIAVVSNPKVAALYGADVAAALQEAGRSYLAITIPDGEQHKTLSTVATLYERFLADGLDRSGTVLSLGGGVTGDLAGFAAATFMRGVRFVQVPTSLLAMVDASVGGKTGCDLPQGKNLVGAFKQPALVLIDPEVLATLDPAEFRSGMAEVLKHGVIGDAALFAALEAGPGAVGEMDAARLARALRVKIEIVEADPFEEGRRAVLNLGHTVGHALERLSGYTLRHGEAVAVGMVVAARLAERLGLADPGLAARLAAALAAWGLPTRAPSYPVASIVGAMVHDKKRRAGRLRWVLPRSIGAVEIVDGVPPGAVEAVLQESHVAG